MATRKTAAPKPAGATRTRTSAPKAAGTKKPTARKTTTARKAPAKPARKGEISKVPRRRTTPTTAAAAPAPAQTEHGATFEAAQLAAKAALDKKAENVVILDVRPLTTYADYLVVASGGSDRQVSAIADNVEEQMKKAGHRPIGMEGAARGNWVLIDFGDVVTHVFYEETRALYDIEGFWADARRIPVEG